MKLCLLIIFAQLLFAFARTTTKQKFEGDIDLRGLPIQAYVKRFQRGNKRLYGSSPLRNAIKGEVYRWKNGKIPYEISNKFGTIARKIIQSAIEEYNQKTCIRWIPKTKESDFVKIDDFDQGCLSPLGRQGGEQLLELGRGCVTKGIIIHEMMHALGFFHEQSRLDRDNYVDILWDNIDPTAGRINFDKYDLEIEDLGFPYDYGSVMHYGSTDFSKDLTSITVQPKDKSAKIGQRLKLSIIDAKKVNKLYKCSDFDISGGDGQARSTGDNKDTVDNKDTGGNKESARSNGRCAKTFNGFKPIDGKHVGYTGAVSETDCASKCHSCQTFVFDSKSKECLQYDIIFPESRMVYFAGAVLYELAPRSECTKPERCVDTETGIDLCDKWAIYGHCFTSRKTMQKYCRKTCMYCGSCENIYEDKYCQFYKNNGFCSRFETVMSYRCMKTCNKCVVCKSCWYDLS